MRLTGGEGKGRKLLDPPASVRPTSGRVRETLFQILLHRLPGANVLDLYAGSGSLGLEALARGAASAVFVEVDRKVQAVIRENVRRCGFEARARVVSGKLPGMLSRPALLGQQFDLIFADPPYAEDVFGELLALIERGELLAGEGLFVFEASSRRELELPRTWSVLRRKEMGDTALLFCELSSEIGGEE